jgi:hypothetical protein
MTILSNSAQIYALPGLEVEEGAQGHNYEQVQFAFKDNIHCGHGNYEVVGDTLNFYVCHQIEGQDFDVEHIMDNGEESVVFGNIGAMAGAVSLKEGRVYEVSISAHPANSEKCWGFFSKKGLRFMTLDE